MSVDSSTAKVRRLALLNAVSALTMLYLEGAGVDRLTLMFGFSFSKSAFHLVDRLRDRSAEATG